MDRNILYNKYFYKKWAIKTRGKVKHVFQNGNRSKEKEIQWLSWKKSFNSLSSGIIHAEFEWRWFNE